MMLNKPMLYQLSQIYQRIKSPIGTIPHRIKIKPNYCPPGPQSLGQLPLGQLPTRAPFQKELRLIVRLISIVAQWKIVY